jgi:hypothetical protein
MLLTREELEFDFGGARFDGASAEDRRFLGWVYNQFLYGEVTGIQCGHWLYRAPSLNAAAFLARQAAEELSHVKRILRILSLLGEAPAPAHPVIRFLSTGMMGGAWGEHVVLEMALGEGLVLGVFYALARTSGDPEIARIVESAAVEEERHVEFGERESQAWLVAHPRSARLYLGLALVQLWGLGKLKVYVARRLARQAEASGAGPHPVLGQFEAFFAHSIRCLELRIERLGLSRGPISRLGRIEKTWLVAMIPLRKVLHRLRFRQSLLTSTYLRDPSVLAEAPRRGL